MLKNKWETVCGISNLGEDDCSVAIRLNDDGTTQIAFAAFSGLKVIELTNVSDGVTGTFSDNDVAMVEHWVDDYYDVAFKAIVDDREAIIVIDECDKVTLIDTSNSKAFWSGNPVYVTDVSEYSCHEYDELSDELLAIFMYT